MYGHLTNSFVYTMHSLKSFKSKSEMTLPDSQFPLDIFSLYHLASGFIFGLLFWYTTATAPVWWFGAVILHQFFELWENTTGRNGGIWFFSRPSVIELASSLGVRWDKYLGDSAKNSAMDTMMFVIGLFGAHQTAPVALTYIQGLLS
jgi:hypothetical protein